MSKLITFKTATKDGPRDAQGFVVWLSLAGKGKHKFVLQLDAHGKPSILADYRTGYKAFDMAARALNQYVARGYALGSDKKLYRVIAQQMIEEAEAARGAEYVQAIFAGPATLNT